jgi:hypothetical protein
MTKKPENRTRLDARADRLIVEGAGAGDDLLTTDEVAEWFTVSTGWLKLIRERGYGPPMVFIAPKILRYRRSDVIKWLEERSFTSTREFRASLKRLKQPRDMAHDR